MIRKGMIDICEELGINVYAARFGSVFVTYFISPPIGNYTDLLRNDKKFFVDYRKNMIDQGIFMLPVNLKRNHISGAHTKEDISETLEKAKISLSLTLKKAESLNH